MIDTTTDPPRLAGMSLIGLVVAAVTLEFFGVGSIGDARLKILLSSAAILLLGNEVRQFATGNSPTSSNSSQTSSSNSQDSSDERRGEKNG